jgi:hypothetical protein
MSGKKAAAVTPAAHKTSNAARATASQIIVASPIVRSKGTI